MIGGVTHHGLPHVRRVPHLHVKLPLEDRSILMANTGTLLILSKCTIVSIVTYFCLINKIFLKKKNVKLPLGEEPQCECAFQPAFVLRIE